MADRIRVIVAESLERRIKDPRLGFVTITDSRVTGDLHEATLYYTVLGSDEERLGTAAALESAKGVLRSEVGRLTGVRFTPTLTFVEDAMPVNAELDRGSAPQGADRRRGGRRRPRGRDVRGRRRPVQAYRARTTTSERVTASPSDGLLVVDKPAGLTSHDVVDRVRRLAGTRKVGHAGTLDPMATGVLVLGIGRATRLLGHLVLTDKAYLGTIRLGETTATDDADGRRAERHDASGGHRRADPGRRGSADRPDRPGAVVGVGGQGRRPARLPAGPRRRGGRTRRPVGGGEPLRRARDPARGST